MEFKELLENVIKNLGNLHKGDVVNVKHSVNEKELFSFLREKIFKTDAKTKDFILKCTTVKEKPIEKKEISEPEFCKFIFEALNEKLARSDSKFKYVSHYFSPEVDLAITISDSSNFRSTFRVLNIKTT